MCERGYFKPHYACFSCRKTFKRTLWHEVKGMKGGDQKGDKVPAKCPDCKRLMANMGIDFEAPKKADVKAWNHMKNLYKVGITFQSCGCTGPGYIPKTKEKLIAYFEELLEEFKHNLEFLRQKNNSENLEEINKENIMKQMNYSIKVPPGLRPKKELIKNEDPKIYWFDRFKEIEQKIAQVKSDKANSYSRKKYQNETIGR